MGPRIVRPQQGTVQVLRFVPNQSEIQGFLLLFPTETFFEKLILTVLWVDFFGCGGGAASQLQLFQQPFGVELLETSLLIFDVLAVVLLLTWPGTDPK